LGTDIFFAKQMKCINDQGKLQPSIVPLVFFMQKFMHEYTAKEVIIVNGSPRSKEELILWQSLISVGYLPYARIINIEVSDEECLKRLKNRPGRPDTLNEDSLKTKLGWYGPIREMLAEEKSQGFAGFRQRVIDGSLSEDLVFTQISEFLKGDIHRL
jgi:adenylate kinase family enzyme